MTTPLNTASDVIKLRVTLANNPTHQNLYLIFRKFPESDQGVNAIYKHKVNRTPIIALDHTFSNDTDLSIRAIAQVLDEVIKEFKASPGKLVSGYLAFCSCQLVPTRNWQNKLAPNIRIIG